MLRLCVAICVLWSSTTAVLAVEYRITAPDLPSTAQAIADFQRQLAAEDTDARLSFVPQITEPDDLLGMLEDGKVDIAVVPFEVVPALANSPLLQPFLAQNAKNVRQAIDSEVGAFEKFNLERDGGRVLDFWHVSSTILGSTMAVRQPLDLKGRKIYAGLRSPDATLRALGAIPMQIAFREVIPALQRGAIDSSVIPFDSRAQTLGIVGLVQHYVDRLYQPRLYAVLASEQRWRQFPFPHQHYLAKAANMVGESLVGRLEAQAESFRDRERARGSIFSAWTVEDVGHVRVASLRTVDPDAFVKRQLVNLAFDSAAAAPQATPDGRTLSASKVTLLFATDRKAEHLPKPETAFSSSRRLHGHTFGLATVALKHGRRLGDNLKEAAQVIALHVVKEDAFWRRSKSALEQDVVVFVHGYNNSFIDSIRRGATIKKDIAPKAIVISYTWPSDGELLSYGYDESSIDTAEQNFKSFLDQLTKKVASKRINVIAHSMGSRLVAKYLAGLPERQRYPNDVKFKNIVLAAADISTEFFEQKEEKPYNPNYPLSSYAERITVYSSQYDRALGFSQKLHRDRRLGLADQNNMYLEADISAIDASLIDPAKWYQRFSFATRHSYVFDKAAGVRDLTFLLIGLDPVDRPNITQGTRNGLDYWVLKP